MARLRRVGAVFLAKVPKRFFFEGLQPEVERAVLAAASTLEQTGARLIDVVVPDADVSQSRLHFSMTLADMADVHREEMERDPERIGAEVLRLLKLGLDISGRDYSNSRRWLVEWRRKLWSLFREVDLLLTPTVPMVAPLRKDSADMIEITRAMARFTSGIGAAGMPSISLPCGFGEGGMPIGVQLVADSFGEALLLRAGVDFQQRTDFHLARPSLLREG